MFGDIVADIAHVIVVVVVVVVDYVFVFSMMDLHYCE
jgi:hypothetical protein